MEKSAEKIIYDIGEKIESYTGIVSNFLDNEILKTVMETSKLVDTAIKLNNQISQKRFEYFLRGFSNTGPTEKQLEKLIKYIDSEERAEFIADAFRKVLLSNSNLATLIMGTLLDSVVKDNGNITHEDLLCINALSQFYDVDLGNFILIAEIANYKEVEQSKKRAVIRFGKRFNELINERQVSRASVILTLEKSTNLQLLFKEYETDVDVDFGMADVSNNELEESYVINSVGKNLLRYVKRVNMI